MAPKTSHLLLFYMVTKNNVRETLGKNTQGIGTLAIVSLILLVKVEGLRRNIGQQDRFWLDIR